MFNTIAKATAVAGLLGVTVLTTMPAPAMAATACRNHNNPAACRARRQAHAIRRENRALRHDIRAQNRFIRHNVYNPYYAPVPVFNPYGVAPAPGITVRF